MASFLNQLGAQLVEVGKAAYERYKAPKDPNSVSAVSASALAPIPVMAREGCIMLYGPKPNSSGGNGGGLASRMRPSAASSSSAVASTEPQNDAYEIVVHSEKHKHQSLSVFRSGSEAEAKRRFGLYKAVVPAVLEMDEALCVVGSLQQMCDLLRSHEDDGNFTLLHLAVSLDFRNVATAALNASGAGGGLKDVVTSSGGQTPLMLAVQAENIWMVKLLVGKDASVLISDAEGNSVFHYAAKTKGKEIIEELCQRFDPESHKGQGEKAVAFKAGDDAMDIGIEHSPDLQILNKRNKEGNTPLHVACLNDKPECLVALLCAGADLNVTGTVNEDFAPMQSALKSTSERGVKEILKMYPKQLHMQDIKYGGTPLHWSKSKEIIEALLTDSDCAIDAKNFSGDTALHVMAKHDRLDCVIALIVRGAEVDARDREGRTPLHVAVEHAHVGVVRALLVFEADTRLENHAGQTPYLLSLKVMQESSLISAISLGSTSLRDLRRMVVFSLYGTGAHGSSDVPPLDSNGQPMDFSGLEKEAEHKRVRTLFDDILANKVKAKQNKGQKGQSRGRILCLDGGGIRGLVLTRMLLSMEKVFESPIVHNFDWITGTSTGGILALALATGKTVMECQYIYFRLKDKVFVDSKPYETGPFEQLLQAEFGNAKMSDIKTPKVCVTATLADRTPPDLHLFRTYPSPQSIVGASDYCHPELRPSTSSSSSLAAIAASSSGSGPPSPSSGCDRTLVWKAARASGAAPSYFRPDGPYVDGGIMSNNPSLDILTEINEFNLAVRSVGRGDAEAVDPEIMLSLGTGIPPVRKTTVVDIFRPESAGDTIKLFMNWDGMGKLMLDSLVDADNRIVDRCRAWCSSLGAAYFRFSPHMAVDVELDEKDDRVLVDLMWSTMAYVHQRHADVMAIKDILN